MKKYILLLFLVFSSSSHSISIVYEGTSCSTNVQILSSPVQVTFLPTSSSIEVIEHINNGIYRLRLHGGMPWYDDDDFCIENRIFGVNDEIFGAEPMQLESTEAVGIFNENKLTITFNSLHTTGTGGIAGNQAVSSIFTARDYTYIFDYDEQNNSFSLSGMIRRSYIIDTIGYSDQSGILRVLERLTPASSGYLFKPPNPNIKYVVAQ